jgi:hypothetical protein
LTLNKEKLVLLRRLAVRKWGWFKFLHKYEATIISLTINCIYRAKSAKPGTTLKTSHALTEAKKSNVERLMQAVGSPLAFWLSIIDLGWSSPSASGWVHEHDFIKFSAVNYINRA